MITTAPTSSPPASSPSSRPAASRFGTLAGRLAVLLLLAAAIPTRVINLDAFAGKFDEGIRGAQLMLMAAGYRPFRDIFASQGPLSLQVFYPTYLLFGQTLGAARLAPALCSIVGLVVVAWTAWRHAGSVGASVAVLVLLLSPTYLKNSRLALVEVPALVPATAALALALAYQRSGDRRWLVGSGILMALALAIKPMVVPVLIPIGLAILLRGRGWLRAGLLFGVVTAGVLGAIVVTVGPSEVYDQMIRFRAASRQAEGWSLKENWAAMAGELVDEQLVVHVAAVAAGLLLLVSRPRLGIPLIAWPLASFGLLMVYSPLQFKHAVIMLPPLGLLVGVGAGEVWRRWRASTARPVAVSLIGAATLLAIWYVASLPAIWQLDARLLSGTPESRPENYDDEVALIGRLTQPSDFIVVDEPSVAFASRRLVPPSLVDTSMVRIRSRSLDATTAIAAAEASDARLLFLFSDGLRSLKRFGQWVDERFVAVKINERRNGKDRTLYLRQDADLEAARATLEQSLDVRTDATFGGRMRLLGYGVQRADVAPGESVTVALGWQAIAPMPEDYAVVTILKNARGEPVEQNQRGLGGGGEGTSSWEPGRWVFRTSTLTLPATTPPGEYTLAVGVYDSKARRLVPVDGTSGGHGAAELSLTSVRVRS
ncbi:MAG: glycosyltransferase family 39 protein [Chloroflexi bacterium]|nr:glycosyltransferase family 39 protein [Chloroflexota bacterium]